jgi:hypothetical protein
MNRAGKNVFAVTPAKAGVQVGLKDTGFLLELIPVKPGTGMTWEGLEKTFAKPFWRRR